MAESGPLEQELPGVPACENEAGRPSNLYIGPPSHD